MAKLTDAKINEIITQGNREFSEVVTNLTKGIIDTETMLPNYEWHLASKFPLMSVFDGVKDYNYVEYNTKNDNKDPYDDITDISELNSVTNKVVRETATANIQSNVSTKILRNEIMNFKTNPQDALATAFKTTINITKKQDNRRETEMWKLVKNGYKINVNGLKPVSTDGGDSISKKFYDFMLKIETTSNKHPFIGKDGVIEVTDKNGVKSSVQPDKMFKSKDFHIFTSPSYQTAITFDGNRAFFNWGAKQMEFASATSLDFAQYSGILDADKTDYADFQIIAIHKDHFQNLVNWEISTMVNLGRAWENMTNYMKFGVYEKKDAPILIWTTKAPSQAK